MDKWFTVSRPVIPYLTFAKIKPIRALVWFPASPFPLVLEAESHLLVQDGILPYHFRVGVAQWNHAKLRFRMRSDRISFLSLASSIPRLSTLVEITNAPFHWRTTI